MPHFQVVGTHAEVASIAAKVAVCYLCHGPDEPIMDTGTDIDMEGRLFICSRCVAEMADLIDWINPDKAEELRRSNKSLAAKNRHLENKLESTERLAQAVADLKHLSTPEELIG